MMLKTKTHCLYFVDLKKNVYIYIFYFVNVFTKEWLITNERLLHYTPTFGIPYSGVILSVSSTPMTDMQYAQTSCFW